ncbi:hypothetical protein ACQV2W_08025 [Facklamia sp. P12934]|uniref:hypothetical protein n=1 Tax=Facklamia sp. P12934 TaxID=3421948 RepID=UPI003D186731
MTSAKNKAVEIFNSIKQAITDKINSAKDAVGNATEKNKVFFNFSWSLPEIKLPRLPRLSITGRFSLTPLQVPRIS